MICYIYCKIKLCMIVQREPENRFNFNVTTAAIAAAAETTEEEKKYSF